MFEQRVYDIFHKPSSGNIVIDVGAHIGLFTLKAAKIVRNKGLVVAIEPHPENFKILKSNIALFRKNIKSSPILLPLNIALGSKDRFATLFLHKGFPGHSSITIRKGERVGIKVQVTTLDKLIAKLGIKHIDFVKIDVEGSEYEVLEGARKTLETNDLKLSMEVHGEIMRRKVSLFLESLGYHILQFKMKEKSYTSYLYCMEVGLWNAIC